MAWVGVMKYINRLSGKFSDYLQDERGNFSVMFGVGATLLSIAVAAALDMGNMTRLQSRLQSQIDMATLTAAQTLPTGNEDTTDYASVVYDVMLANGYDKASAKPAITTDGTYLNVSTSIEYEGMFAGVLKGGTKKIGAKAQASLPGFGNVEMVLVLDNTQSMEQDGKMAALKIGSKKIVAAVKKSGTQSNIALVPFAKYVNIGDESGSWLDKPAEFDTTVNWNESIYTGGECHMEDVERTRDGVTFTEEEEVCVNQDETITPRSTVIESRYEGCVGTSSERKRFDPVSISNKVPGLLHRIPGSTVGLGWDVEAYCPMDIVGLTHDYNKLNYRLGIMWGVDSTYIPSGLLWGERVLDRSIALDQPAKEDGVRQVMILMTDGKDSAQIMEGSWYEDDMESPPYIYAYSDTTVATKANADTTTLCNSIKGKDIELFTISFRVDDVAAKALVADCATSPAHAYDANSNAALIKAFETIAGGMIQNVRLTR